MGKRLGIYTNAYEINPFRKRDETYFGRCVILKDALRAVRGKLENQRVLMLYQCNYGVDLLLLNDLITFSQIPAYRRAKLEWVHRTDTRAGNARAAAYGYDVVTVRQIVARSSMIGFYKPGIARWLNWRVKKWLCRK